MYHTTEIEPQVSENLYNLGQLKEIADGSAEFLISLAGIYISTVPSNTKQMVQAAEAEDWFKVSELAHKIKPTIDSMNIISITSDIRTLEADAKNRVNTHALAKIAAKVDNVINKVAVQLKYEYNL